jgi:hypothetical protein
MTTKELQLAYNKAEYRVKLARGALQSAHSPDWRHDILEEYNAAIADRKVIRTKLQAAVLAEVA